MISELAGELVSRGHEVTVLHLNWNEQPGRETRILTGEYGEQVIDVVPRAICKSGSLINKISKFLLSNRHARQEMHAHLGNEKFDATVLWTPALTVAQPLRTAIGNGVPKHILFVFDFFPVHQKEIGVVPSGPIYWITKALEDHLYRKFTAIICNFPGNIEYLKQNYPVHPETRLLSTPLWSDISEPITESRTAMRMKYDLPEDRPIAIFGGQITEGRGIEQMLNAAHHAKKQGSDLIFLFVGNGRSVSMVTEHAERLDNVRHIAGVKRNEYLSLVSACDIGMVATVDGVSSFSFPTKTIDYLRAGLKIVAAVEKGSDYLKLLSDYHLGKGVEFNNGEGYYLAAEALAQHLKSQPEDDGMARRCLEEVFHVRHAADTLLKAAGDDVANEFSRG